MTTHADIQALYIDELREKMEFALQWWSRNGGRDYPECVERDDINAFELRWIGGPASHPNIIQIYRKYSYLIEDCNNGLLSGDVDLSDRQPTETDWGEDLEEGNLEFQPVELLIHDLPNVAPDLVDVMEGFMFLPIGTGENREVTDAI